MTLSPQREKFAQEIANGLSQADAYRSAYPKSLNWKPETVWNNASKLMANADVLTRVESLRAELAEKQLWKREDSVRALKQVIEAPDKISDVVAAVKELNAMHGYHAPIKQEMTINPAAELAALQEARKAARDQ